MASEQVPVVMLFFILSFLFGSLSRLVVWATRLPYSIVMFFFGLALGLLGHYFPSVGQISSAFTQTQDPHLIFFIFLPVLVFESVLNIDVNVFRRVVIPCLAVAGPGLLIISGCTGAAMRLFYPDWSWTLVLLFGAIVSATDPVAVVALLKELGAPEQVNGVIEGESLLNDGSAIVAFNILLAVVEGGQVGGVAVVGQVGWIIGGGVLGGLFFGWCYVLLLSWAVFEPLVEITLTICCAYSTFYVAEGVCGVSGVLALVTCGLYVSVNRTSCITPEVQELMYQVWELLVYLANTVVFAFVGVAVADAVLAVHITSHDVLSAVLLYVVINVVRCMVVALFYPLLHRPLGWRGCIVVGWAGLRGAVGLVLAFVVSRDPHVSSTVGSKFVFHTAVVVCLTLVVNGLLTKPLVKYLTLDKVSDAGQLTIHSASTTLRKSLRDAVGILEGEQLLQDCDWTTVRAVTVRPLNRHLRPHPLGSVTVQELARLRFLEAVQSSVSLQYRRGLLGSVGVTRLSQVLHACRESPNVLFQPAPADQYWAIPWYLRHGVHLPLVGLYCRQAATERWANMYDAAVGYIRAVDDAIKVSHQDRSSLHDLSESGKVLLGSEDVPDSPRAAGDAFARATEAVIDQYRAQRDVAWEQLETLRRRHPTIATGVATHDAARSVLNHGQQTLQALHEEGVLPNHAMESLTHALQQQMKRLSPSMLVPVASPLVFDAMWKEEDEDEVEENFHSGDFLVRDHPSRRQSRPITDETTPLIHTTTPRTQDTTV